MPLQILLAMLSSQFVLQLLSLRYCLEEQTWLCLFCRLQFGKTRPYEKCIQCLILWHLFNYFRTVQVLCEIYTLLIFTLVTLHFKVVGTVDHDILFMHSQDVHKLVALQPPVQINSPLSFFKNILSSKGNLIQFYNYHCFAGQNRNVNVPCLI